MLLLSFLLFAALFFWYYPGWIVQDEIKVAFFEKINPFKKWYTEVLLTIRKPDGDHVTLVNYKESKNPPWKDLSHFLKMDQTDQKYYSKGAFVCSNFAEELHNNAEKAGLKAGFVIITFKKNPVGHTANVFETTDRGRVFIDDTGITFSSSNELKSIESKVQKTLAGNKGAPLDPVLKKMMDNFLDYAASRKQYADSVAFLEKNRPYGILPVDFPDLEFTYPCWEKIKKERESYRRGFESYTSDLKATSKEYVRFSDALSAYNGKITDFFIRQKQYEVRNSALKYQAAAMPKKLINSVTRYNPSTRTYERIDYYGPDPRQVSIFRSEEAALRIFYYQLQDESRNLDIEVKKLNAWGKKVQQKIARLKKTGEEINRQVERAGISVFFNDKEEIVKDFTIVW